MKSKIGMIIVAGLFYGLAAHAGEAKKLAVFDFQADGQAEVTQGQDVADNVRLAFYGSARYKVEPYRRMMNAVTAAVNSGLDLTATADICRVGNALGDNVVVTGTVTSDNGKYVVHVTITEVATKEVVATYDGEGADLRSTAEATIQGIAGSQKFGVLFPEDVRDFSGDKDKETRDAISLVASEEELALYDILSPRGKSMMLDKFWLRRDPDAATPANEFEDEFWKRVAYAREYFTTPITEGMRSDRGKVYIKYGPPQDIEDHSAGTAVTSVESSSWSTEPYIVWKYPATNETGGRRMLFVFIDQDADGEYNVFASTEPGYGKRIATYTEFDANRLRIDAEDTGEADKDTYWDPARHAGIQDK